MKKMKIKIVATIITFIIMIGIISNYNIVHATETVNLYSKEKLQCLKYKGMLVRTEFVVYNENNKEYPVYCLNRDLEGVSIEKGGYNVEKQGFIENILVWRAIINGYPYKSYEELKCDSEIEAFTATKLAVYDMLYNYDWNDFEPVNQQGQRVLNAIKIISQSARESTKQRLDPELRVVCENSEWQINGDYMEKIYSVNSQCEFTEYNVKLQNCTLENIKLSDIEDNEKKSFGNNEKFKIIVPIQSFNVNGSFEIKIETSLKTYPVLYGNPPSEDLQDYAICKKETEDIKVFYKEKYDKNLTQIQIIKQDKQTKEVLGNCEFTLYNENNQIISKNISNENGKIEFTNLLPGKYYIKETKVPEGYNYNNEIIEIKLDYNECIELVIENEKPTTNIEIEPEIIKLPKTGY